MLNQSFTAQLIKSPKPGGWTYVIWRESATFFGTRGLVKVKATVDECPFQSSFIPRGDGNHKPSVKAEILEAIRKSAWGDVQGYAAGKDRSGPQAEKHKLSWQEDRQE
jgi:hypothetical protein